MNQKNTRVLNQVIYREGTTEFCNKIKLEWRVEKGEERKCLHWLKAKNFSFTADSELS